MRKKQGGRYTREFLQYAVERMRISPNITALAKELGVPRTRLYEWQQILDPHQPEKSEENWTADAEKDLLQQQLRQTKQLLAERSLEVDFLKGALQRVEARRPLSDNSGAKLSTKKSGK